MDAVASSRTRSLAILFIAIGMFGLYVVEFGLVGILPSIISRYDISIVEASWLVGSFALIIALLGPFMVIWLGRLNRRLILIGSLLVFAICSAASAFAPNYASLLAIRVPAALLQAVFFAVAFTTARGLYPPEKSAHAISLVFIGTSMGMVLGVPITALVEARFSYETAFYFSTVTNAVAALGLWMILPKHTKQIERTRSNPLRVLRKPLVWLALLQVILSFSAMMSVYSFAAEYLRQVAQADGETISLLLVVFGVGGLLGNLIAGRLLGRSVTRTVLAYPIVLSAAYLILMMFGTPNLWLMGPVCLVWGAAHTAGMVIGQVWTTSSTDESPEFVTSLFVSAGNFGVMGGAAAGGLFISSFGVQGSIWSAWAFAAAALAIALISVMVRQHIKQ